MSSWSEKHEVYWFNVPGKKIDCFVCGSPSSGKHYGVFTCEGCKCFYNRTMRYNLKYSCRGNRNCPVTREKRLSCQDCRIRKCIAVGMRKDAIKKGRPPKFSYQSRSSTRHQKNDLLSTLLQAERFHGSCWTYTTTHQPHLVIAEQLPSTILISVLEWIKLVPFFSCLTLNNQKDLMRQSWSSLFVIFCAQYGIDEESFDIKQSKCLRASGIVKTFQDQINSLREFKLTMLEYACLKTLILISVGYIDDRLQEELDYVTDTLLKALQQSVICTHPEDPSRYSKILLALSSLGRVQPLEIAQIFLEQVLKDNESIDHLITRHIDRQSEMQYFQMRLNLSQAFKNSDLELFLS